MPPLLFEHVDLVANLLLAAEMCGGAQACIDYTVDYLNTRTQFGKKIGAFQALKHETVDAYVDYEKARSHLYSAAWVFSEQGRNEIAVRMAKAQADKAFSFAADRAIQFHGGFGFTYDCDAQLYRRRAMWCAAQFGDARWQKKKPCKIVARIRSIIMRYLKLGAVILSGLVLVAGLAIATIQSSDR